MTTTLKEQAWQSGLVLLDETPEWDENDWPALMGGGREYHASVVLDHPEEHDNDDHKRQTVVVLGGWQPDQGIVNSVLVLNLADSNKQWREGPPMNKRRNRHAAVVCNGGVYVVGGYNGRLYLDCIERIDANNLLRSSLTTTTTQDTHWTTLTCRLSKRRWGCCAVAVQNRYIAVMGGCDGVEDLLSVDIIDARNHTVIEGPSMTVPRLYFCSAVVGHRIFVVGGRHDNDNLDSLEYLDYTTPCDSDETKKETGSTFISSSSTWITHSALRLSNARGCCAMVAVGSCLVVVGGGWHNSTMEVLDTHHNRVWNLPPFGNDRDGCSMVTVANQVVVIGGGRNSTCATLPLMERNSWCFRQLCEQQSNGWYHSLEGIGIQ